MDPEHPVSIAIADDHAVVRSALRALLDAEEGLDVCGEASDLGEAVALVAELNPDVLVLDLSMASESGLEGMPRILEASPQTRIVVVTMHDDTATARSALEAGATGYVLKASAASELVEAVREAAEGRAYVGAALRSRLAREPQTGRPGESLTERETEVLALIALGHTNNEIAGLLDLSVRTVESHRVHVHQKLGVQSRAELVRYALDHGLMKP